MDFTLNQLIVFLALFSIGAVLAFALISKKKTEERMRSNTAKKSTLAKDAPDRS